MFGSRMFGSWLARYLSKPREDYTFLATSKHQDLADAIRKGDVLLVEGTSRISGAIKYLTQSTWSHAALCIANPSELTTAEDGEPACVLIEADIEEGVRGVPLSEYSSGHTRICRPVGLDAEEIDRVIAYMMERIGYQYDLKNIFDLGRYLFPTPPVPSRWRRKVLELGSGDPTKAICSSLIAQAFQSLDYPILPHISYEDLEGTASERKRKKIFKMRHHSLICPRDFDVSPYFQIVKPTLDQQFDPHKLQWKKHVKKS